MKIAFQNGERTVKAEKADGSGGPLADGNLTPPLLPAKKKETLNTMLRSRPISSLPRYNAYRGSSVPMYSPARTFFSKLSRITNSAPSSVSTYALLCKIPTSFVFCSFEYSPDHESYSADRNRETNVFLHHASTDTAIATSAIHSTRYTPLCPLCEEFVCVHSLAYLRTSLLKALALALAQLLMWITTGTERAVSFAVFMC